MLLSSKSLYLVLTLFVLLGVVPLRHLQAAEDVTFTQSEVVSVDTFLTSQKAVVPLAQKEVAAVFGQESTITEALRITERILKIYPPEKYHYVFVGRSLALIKALMDNKGIANTGLPFRGKSFDLSFSAANAQEVAALIQTHLNEHLPKSTERQGKELVLLDFTLSGAGLYTAQKVLDWYYSHNERLNLLRVTTNPFSLSSVTPAFLNTYHNKSIRISADTMFAKHLLNSNFDSYAGYGTFNILTGQYLEYDRSTSDRYENLKDWISTEILGQTPRRRLRCVSYLKV